MMFFTRAWAIATAIVVAAALAQPAAAKDCGDAIPCECGDTLIASRTLQLGQDAIVGPTRLCTTPGLIIPVAGVVLDLDNNAIQGNVQMDEKFLNATGILIAADNVTVRNGKMSGFRRAISTTPDGTTINTTNGSTIKNMTFGGNPKQLLGNFENEVGILLYGSGNTIQGNVVTDSQDNGIQIGDGTNTFNDGNALISNTVSESGFGSADPGISVQGCANTFKDNSATGNASIGIRSRFPANRQPPGGLDPQHPTCNIDLWGNTSSGNCQQPGSCFTGGPDTVPVECNIDDFPCIQSSPGQEPLDCNPDGLCGDTVPCCCGDTLIASRTLLAGVDDVVTLPRLCPGAGLIIGADGVDLDLGGNTIRGLKGISNFAAAGFGVVINADNVSVQNGTINLFDRGISVTILPEIRPTNLSTIRNVTLSANRRGMTLFGSSNTIEQNTIVNSLLTGVSVGNDDVPGTTDQNNGNQFIDNIVNSNGLGGTSGSRGLTLIGCENHFEGNVAKFNGAEGITVNPAVGVTACNLDDFGNRGAGNCQFLPEGDTCQGQCTVDDFPCVQALPGNTTVGLFKTSKAKFFLRNALSAGDADEEFKFGTKNAGWLPISGDWTGDGKTLAGLYDPETSTFHLRIVEDGVASDLPLVFDPPNAGRLPIAGDWDGDGVTTIGLYDPVKSKFFLRNAPLAGGNPDTKFKFGTPNAGLLPIAGDWTGTGKTEVGLYAPSNATFLLRNVQQGTFIFGPANAGRVPLAGDWDGDGDFTVGLYDPVKSKFLLKNANDATPADKKFKFTPLGAGVTGFGAISGNWDGLNEE